MSFPEPEPVFHWQPRRDTEQAGNARFVAPGSVVNGEFGLFEIHTPPGGPGAMPHFHRGFSESFYVLSGRLAVLGGRDWRVADPGDFVHVPAHGVHAFHADGDQEARFLILFVPGAPRERFFRGMVELWSRPVRPTDEEVDAFALECDQVNLRGWESNPL